MTQNAMRQYPDHVLASSAVSAPTGSRPPVAQAGDQSTALQILSMAQRTAEEHVATARREAEQIRDQARAAAADIIAEAQARAGSLREDAERVLARARASADQVARESQALASRTEQDASDLLGDAHGRAEEIVQRARANAGDISHRAQQAYDDVVGGLSAKREMLQQQIEALECFDREYRARLTSFMQQQLRALWVDQPQPPIEVDPREVAELMAVPDDRSADLPAAPADR